MKIVDMQAYLLAIPLKETEYSSRWFMRDLNQIIVEVKTDQGLIGYGESFAYFTPRAVVSVINDVLKPTLLGAEPTNISFLHDQMSRQTHLAGRYGITTFAISGVDIALWDIVGKCAGLPLYQLLGGAKEKKVPAYASLPRYSDLEKLKIAALHAKSSGYEQIKLHQLDVESLKLVRETVGEGIRLMMDINCAWSPEKAIEMARKFAPYNLQWLEEPIWPPEDFRNLARLAQIGGIPIATGENACTAFQFKAMLDAEAATYIQPSVIKVGGITEWRKIAGLAEVYNVKVAPHSPYFGPGLLATAHLVASTHWAHSVEYYYLSFEANVFKTPPTLENGFIYLPEGPGLGLEIDPYVLHQYKVTL
ncbi:MAG: mandelate racemase/muconate lactonizing enzyme family protein [bacterium]